MKICHVIFFIAYCSVPIPVFSLIWGDHSMQQYSRYGHTKEDYDDIWFFGLENSEALSTPAEIVVNSHP